jgi:PKD repeat protein
VCSFDGRASTDENPTGLTYQWTFGLVGTASGPTPTKTFSSPGSYPVTLLVKDEWGATSSTQVTVPISTPPGNTAPTPAMAASCTNLFCTVNAAGTVDPNAGDAVTYSWNWGDGTPASTGQSTTHSYAGAGTFTIQLTVTDGWGATATKSTQVTVAP